jgi:hypothetical protein
VHSLAQFREEPRRHLPKLILAAAGVAVVAAAGVGVVVSTAGHGNDGAAGITPTDVPVAVPNLTTEQVASQVQQSLERSSDPVLHGSAGEIACARKFATGRPNPTLRLVQPARVDGERATLIGLQGGSPRDIQVYVVTGCHSSPAVASLVSGTNVTLRNR